jgi:ABC-type dipeptide/oligopeptide/nickel transport system permease component
MRMTTYIVRRILLLIPVLFGVITIVFVLFHALPIADQLTAHFGNPPKTRPCAYESSCPCKDETQTNSQYPGNTCKCIDSNVTVTKETACTDPIWTHDTTLLGLNQPIWTQWTNYTYHALTFQWGRVENDSVLASSVPLFKNMKVTTAIRIFLPYTLELAALSLAIILAVALPLGNLAAANRNRPIDQISRVISFSGFALPAFLLGSLAVIGIVLVLTPVLGTTIHPPWCRAGEVLSNQFVNSWPQTGTSALTPNCYGVSAQVAARNNPYPSWLILGFQSTPTGFPTVDAALHGDGWLALDTVLQIIIPALVIAFGTIATVLRFVRNSMLEVMNLDFVRTARAKGASEKTVIKRHAGRNSLNVTITVLGLTFAGFLGGFPVIESVFHLWGVGYMLAVSIEGPQSYAMILGSTVLFTYIVVVANLIVDVLYAYLDPRVRLG